MNLSPHFLHRTLEALLLTHEHELTCEEAAQLLDRYVDQRLAGAVDDSPEMRLIEEHQKICPECREECEAVLRALRGNS